MQLYLYNVNILKRMHCISMEARKKKKGWEVKLKNKIIFPQTFDTYIYGLSLASICCSFFFQALLLLWYSFLGYKWLLASLAFCIGDMVLYYAVAYDAMVVHSRVLVMGCETVRFSVHNYTLFTLLCCFLETFVMPFVLVIIQ